MPVATSTDPWDGVTDVGVCEGDGLFYYEDAQLNYVDCLAYGLQCGYDAQSGFYDCH